MRPQGTIRDYRLSYGTIWDHTGPKGTKEDHRGPQRNIGDNSGPQGTRGDHRGPQGTIGDHRGQFFCPFRKRSMSFQEGAMCMIHHKFTLSFQEAIKSSLCLFRKKMPLQEHTQVILGKMKTPPRTLQFFPPVPGYPACAVAIIYGHHHRCDKVCDIVFFLLLCQGLMTFK